MKRIYIIVAAALLATGVQAQDNLKSNYLGLTLGGGMNTILYNPVNGSHDNGLGFGAGLQYAHFFGKHFGFGFGAQYAIYNATATYNQNIIGHLTTHPDNGLNYYPVAAYNNWRERQTLNVLSIPVEILWRTALNDSWALMIGLGAQFDMTVGASYGAVTGTYETQGYFPSTGITYHDLPNYGFSTHQANQKGDIDVSKNGVSVIADAGVNHALGNNWGLYLGIYASYGLSNLYNTADANNDMLRISSTNSSEIEYNSTIASDRINAYNLMGAGVKVGINLGWNCKHGKKGDDGSIVPYASEADKAAADRAAEEARAAAQAQAQQAAAEAQAQQAAAQAQAAEAQAQAQQAAEAARNAQYATDAALNQAMQSIDNDIASAEELAKQSGSSAAQANVDKAKATARKAQAAYNDGKYADAYTLMEEAYALLADSYAKDAEELSKQSNNQEAAKAAQAAATYADAARNNDLAGAMAAMRNASINASKTEAEATPTANNNNNNNNNGNNNGNGQTPVTQADMANIIKYFEQINTGVHFDFNGSTPVVSNGSDIALRALAAAMAADKNLKITCVGHTDSIGGESYNQSLGLRRAQALKSLLVNYGAPARNISTESCGKNEPVASNDTEENRALNRRATVKLK